MVGLDERYYPKLGEAVVVTWKKTDTSAFGGTEGVALGVLGDKVSGEYLVIDRSTYRDSFKSALFFLNLLDLKVVPVNEIDFIRKTNVRKRPPGISEKFSMVMEANYNSNIDFNASILKVEKHSDCKSKRVGNSLSETYQLKINEISEIEGTSILISCKRLVQIFCNHKNLDRSINWLQEAVELLPEHKRLVLIPTKITYKINGTYKEPVRSTDEVINQIAMAKDDGQPVILPMGWAHRFFSELDENPLQGFFPRDMPLHDYVLEKENQKKKSAIDSSCSVEGKSKKSVNLNFPESGVNVNKYLGSSAPVVRVKGLIKSTKDEEDLMKMWLSSRSDIWQWGEIGQIQGKMLIHDLTINRKKGEYTVEIRKYSGNEF